MVLKPIFAFLKKIFFSDSVQLFLTHLLLHTIIFCFIFIQVYKALCYSKVTLDWFPLLNPYLWPFFLIKKSTQFYFYFWSKLVPKIKLYIISRDLSYVIALDALIVLLYICQTIYTYIVYC